MTTCSIDGCDKKVYGKGWCSMHHRRWFRHGDPLKLIYDRSPEKFLRALIASPANHADCVIWPYARNDKGYGTAWIDGKPIAVHRWVCRQLNGEPPTEKHEAAHSCGKGHLGCCSPAHVRWATRLENQHDRIEHETTNRGSRNGFAKITEEIAQAIMSDIAAGVLHRGIAKRHGISMTRVSDIKRGLAWTHVTDQS